MNLNFFTEKHLVLILYSIMSSVVVTWWITDRGRKIQAPAYPILYSTLKGDNDSVNEILNRQLAVYSYDTDIFCGRKSSILQDYKLYSIEELLRNLQIKSTWQYTAKTTVNTYWTDVMGRALILENGQLFLCNLNELQVEKVRIHYVWSSVDSIVLDVKRGIIKARMIIWVYNLQQQKAKFSKIPTDPKM